MRKIIKLSAILAMILLMAVGLTGCILDDILPPLVSTCDHEWQDATCTEPYQCVLCGETEGAPLGHHWHKATCATPEICSRCGEKHGEPLDHDWSKPTCTEPATCHMCGITNGRPDGHKWSTPTCTEPAYCYHCGETDGEPLDHDWSKPTCTEPAYCYHCGETDGEPLDHDWSMPTCTEPAYCYRCGDSDGESVGHVLDKNNKCIYCNYSCAPSVYGSSEIYSKSSGDDIVTVVFSIKDNPGVLGMTVSIEYNSDVMELIDCSNGEAFSALEFYYSISDNSAIWYETKIDESDIKDGEFLILTFKMNPSAKCDVYKVIVNFVNSICDNNGHDIRGMFTSEHGTITVTD